MCVWKQGGHQAPSRQAPGALYQSLMGVGGSGRPSGAPSALNKIDEARSPAFTECECLCVDCRSIAVANYCLSKGRGWCVEWGAFSLANCRSSRAPAAWEVGTSSHFYNSQ